MVGSCDFDIFIFRYRLCIMRLKFPKFERTRNAVYVTQTESFIAENSAHVLPCQLKFGHGYNYVSVIFGQARTIQSISNRIDMRIYK
jgi:hypothetical protein